MKTFAERYTHHLEATENAMLAAELASKNPDWSGNLTAGEPLSMNMIDRLKKAVFDGRFTAPRYMEGLDFARRSTMTRVRVSAETKREIKRWRRRVSKGRHSPRGGKKPVDIGPKIVQVSPNCWMGPPEWITRRARRTVGIRKPKRRGAHGRNR